VTRERAGGVVDEIRNLTTLEYKYIDLYILSREIAYDKSWFATAPLGVPYYDITDRCNAP